MLEEGITTNFPLQSYHEDVEAVLSLPLHDEWNAIYKQVRK